MCMSIEKIVSVDPTRFKLNPDNTNDFRLTGFHCCACDIFVFGAATNCQKCTDGNVIPVDFSGDGVLYSYTLIKVPPAGWTGTTPYVLAEGELLEGPHVLAELVDTNPEELFIGMPLKVSYAVDESAKQAVAVYKWKLSD